jgi:hypothetical protein
MSIDAYLKQYQQTDYLGDGAYVGFTGYSYVIFTTNGITVQNEVHLETTELKALRNFVERVTGAPFDSM